MLSWLRTHEPAAFAKHLKCAVDAACSAGRTAVVEWALDVVGFVPPRPEWWAVCALDVREPDMVALESRKIAVLQWLLQRFGSGVLSANLTCNAADGRFYRLLEWAYEEGSPVDERVAYFAHRREDRQLLAFAERIKAPLPGSGGVISQCKRT